ncbi:MAG: hypothetical protein HQM11_18800 [SAR324 cluster bacterium]|nr:hypothetical protein [SAR324 cluster bacterium]
MAKKVKKRKSGMEKRRQQKTQKKSLQKRKHSSRSPQQIQSYKQLQKILINLPTLAYHADFQDVAFEGDAITSLKNEGLSEPDIIGRLITPEFKNMLKEKLAKIEMDNAPQSQNGLFAKATIYAIDNEQEIPLFVNPLLVAIYLRSLARIDGQELSVSEVGKAVKAYEERNTAIIESMLNKDNEHELIEEMLDEELNVSGDREPHETYVEENVLDAFQESLSHLNPDDVALIMDDVDTFIEEYVQTPVSEWTVEYVTEFTNTWFVQNMNPLPEDVDGMKKSLTLFVRFLEQENSMSKSIAEAIISGLSS